MGKKKKSTKINIPKKQARTKAKQSVFLSAYRDNLLNISRACEIAEIDRTLFYQWIEKYPDFKEKVEAVEEKFLDYAESKLKKAVAEGNMTALIFFLKTKGRNRGYVERKEVENSGSMNIILSNKFLPKVDK